ncbi:MAG: hypothetical protein MUF87_10010 [Anaerolineae bacterium]|jgi:hypothetical protein|nr:hypothetical protein [Anaerolineae bacterium]
MLKTTLLKITIVLSLLLSVIITIAATNAPRDTTITSFFVTCDSVTFAYTSTASGGFDAAVVTVENISTATQLYFDSQTFSPFGDSGTIMFDPQPSGSVIRLTVQTAATALVSQECGDAKGTPTVFPTVTGTPPPVSGGDDGRFCFAPGEAPAALYARGGGLDIYRITGNNGERVISVSAADLTEYPARPESLVTIAVDNNIAFYKLTTGLYQVNVIDPATGKIHVCQFAGIPTNSVIKYTVP